MTNMSNEERQKCKADIVYFIEKYCTYNGQKIKLKDAHKAQLRRMQQAYDLHQQIIVTGGNNYGKRFCHDLANKYIKFREEQDA